METTPSILFICPHGAAESVIAAAYCRQELARRAMQIDATSAGTEPDTIVPPAVVEYKRLPEIVCPELSLGRVERL